MPVACHLSAAHTVGLLPDACTCWWPAACHQRALVAFCLSSACANALPPVGHTHLWTSACHRNELVGPATCCRRTSVAFHLSPARPVASPVSPACAGGLPSLVVACWLPSAYHLCVTLACHLSPVHAIGLPPFTSTCRWPSLSYWHEPDACHLLPTCTGACRLSLA